MFLHGQLVNPAVTEFPLDEIAKLLYLSDALHSCTPVKVLADGYCLFHAASLIATGDECAAHVDLRRLTADELFWHSKFYADLCYKRAISVCWVSVFQLVCYRFAQCGPEVLNRWNIHKIT